ncbi:methyltransferase family protein [Idiomarina fontislapidosi]|uniref:2-polyprenyl-3-methyl-5-hydroxy-6-metoxy-1, 4-benzoquinol methylase n=1 Tax=Idiomarina fontislapidosi TaxID=263723 RepID=A0A432XP26_9GAMM|nr:class I SAM-dependent methyltransferase [Idiomarina fontislapidosi]PYE30504.1 methyltransferase family protein [Idiomarina fontislapidosi]RUO50434.1 2-polyprenyl-3-methyl-5-hydroxy-6-metoxy-1,4-benzoquinol methylase [Idiomarina fontislapidosi]
MLLCPLCESHTQFYARDRRRSFYQCEHCQLVFADPKTHIDLAEEKRLYETHENDPADAHYRGFLNRLWQPLKVLCQQSNYKTALDFGSGPGPTLHLMMREAGLDAHHYDPIYSPDKTRLSQSYDVVTCTEVIEHFCYPQQDFIRLRSLVKPGGVLATMTKPCVAAQQFPNWHYKNDLTHVSFFSERTYHYIAERFGFSVDRVSDQVTFFRCVKSC